MLQFIVNGIVGGSLIALTALAWQLVYLPTRILFIALAAIYALAPFIAGALLQSGVGAIGAIAGAVVSAVAVGVLCEVLNHAPLQKRGASNTSQFITSLGIYMVLIQLIALQWGSGTHTLRTGIEGVSSIGTLQLLHSQILTLLVAGTTIGCVLITIMATSIGLRLRALSDNSDALALMGYDIGSYRRRCFAAAAACATVPSLLSAYSTGFDPFLGLNSTLVALAAVLIGGRHSFVGPVVAAFVLGVARALTVWLTSPQWQDPLTFGVLAAVLVIRPDGLMRSTPGVEQAS